MSNQKNRKSRAKSELRNKSNPINQIAKSKQLWNKKFTCPRQQSARVTKRNEESCSNCTLPSLADLELMFDNSTPASSNNTANLSAAVIDLADNSTNAANLSAAEIGSAENSTNTANLSASVIDSVENSTNTASKDVECIPEEIPIVIDLSSDSYVLVKPKFNCNESIIVIDNLSDDSGVERPTKKRKTEESTSKPCDLSTNNVPQTESSNDSDVTVEYDVDISRPGRFSPLPSTSRDSDTIHKNEIRFNASLISNESIEGRESPEKVTEPPKPIINEISVETIVIDDEDEFPIVVCTSAQENNKRVQSPTSLDNEYNTIPLNEESVINISDFSIEEIISENSSILKKYSVQAPVTVTKVPPIQPKNQISTSSDLNTNNGIPVAEPTLPAVQIHSSNQSNHINNESRTNFNTNNNELRVEAPIANPNNRISNIINEIFNSVLLPNNNCELHTRNRRKRKRRTPRSLVGVQCSAVRENNNTNITRVAPSNVSALGSDSGNNVSTTRENNSSIATIESNNISTSISGDKNVTRENNNTNVSGTNSGRNIGDCPICLDSLSSKSISSTVCGHIFCTECIKRAVSTSKRCPACRKLLKNNGYHQIFL